MKATVFAGITPVAVKGTGGDCIGTLDQGAVVEVLQITRCPDFVTPGINGVNVEYALVQAGALTGYVWLGVLRIERGEA